MPGTLRLIAAALLLALAAPAAAFPTQDDDTAGAMALHARKNNNVWTRFDLGVFDGKVTTTPPDSTSYDRRIETGVDVGGDGFLTKRFAVRANVKADLVRRRVSGDDSTTSLTDESTSRYEPSLDLTFITDKGLELFGGMMVDSYGAATRTDESPNGKTTTKYASGNVSAKRFGVIRRAGKWSGGFYYVSGSEETRDVEVEAFDGSTNSTDETIFIPSRVGVVGDFDLGAHYDFELDFVQARGKGPKDERGNTAYTDYFEARFGAMAFFGGLGFQGQLAHRTLSYASSAFVTLETIPVTSLKALVLLGDEKAHAYAGIIGGYGKDGQSLPEFNAEYQLTGYAATLGFFTPF